jgi:DNA-binding protein HU-beta
LDKEEPLNRKELVDAIQKHTLVARTDVDKVLGSLIQHTQVAVKKGDRVSLVGFGTFERQDRKARTARNPRSGAPVKVKATKVPRFRAGQGFKDVVAGKATAPKLSPVKSTAKATTAKATTAKATTAKATTAKATVSRATTSKASTARASTAKASTSKAASRNSAPKSTAKAASSRGKAKSGKKK